MEDTVLVGDDLMMGQLVSIESDCSSVLAMVKANAPHLQATTSQSGRIIDDSSSPYFLQNGDNPGLVLVSHFLADLLYGAWIRCNSMVILWLLNAVSREIADSLMYMATAHEIWIDLRERFNQGSMDVSTYYTRLRTLWDELKDFQPVSIRAQVLMMDPIPVISKIFSLVVQEERQRTIHSDISGSSLDHSSHSSPNPSIAIVKGPSYGKNDKGIKSDLPTCSHCHYPGHTSDKCYQLHGYPPSHPKYKPKQYSVTTSNASKVRANHLKVADTPANLQPTSSAPDSLSPDQCKQLLAFLSTQLQLG
ncbi:uncharacterized protein LOC142512543 [Primulina tabacum]|uniref:uncharacterized protein LOC142512543 n=1 Tax=Primulina tabacum TaxID=48773 RepID=UPI003F59817D